eukprot:6741816-Ditylum_brightwellii.AAC.1
MEESGVDAFVDPGVSATNGFVVELDGTMSPECNFLVCNWLSCADRVNGMKVVKFSWLTRPKQGLLLDFFLKSKFEKVKRERNLDNHVVVRSTVNYSAITVAYLCAVVVLFAGSVDSHNLSG